MMPGLKTTEFWLAIGLVALVTVGPRLGLTIDKDEILHLLGIFGIYTGSRTVLKAKEASIEETKIQGYNNEVT